MENLEIYNKVREVPKEAQKNFSNGSFSGTDINPQWRIKMLTEVFGPAGIGWYTEVVEHWNETINGEILTYVAINLYVKVDGEWSKPIYGIGGNKALQQFKSGPKVSDECYKMAYTDAISVACKALGIGADIYWQNDPTKYSQYYQEPAKQPTPASIASGEKIEDVIAKVKAVTSRAELESLFAQHKDKFGNVAAFLKAFQDMGKKFPK